MTESSHTASHASHRRKRRGIIARFWSRLWVRIVVTAAVVSGVAFFFVALYVAHNAEPILRKRIIATVSERFHSPAQLDGLSISVVKGIEVQGTGLRVQALGDPAAPSMISVDSFEFRTTLHRLLYEPTHVVTVYAHGLTVHVPPSSLRTQFFSPEDKRLQDQQVQQQQSIFPKVDLLISHILVDGAKLIIDTDKPGKGPLTFDVLHVNLTDVNWSRPFHYDALLTNPKPTGLIHAHGMFGPWNANNPRETTIDGEFTFDDVDLGSIRGISGRMSASGRFGGKLDGLTADGTADTPNFALDTANHPLPLHAVFHATVDGTTGDTTLDPVQARLGHSNIVARGKVTRIPGKGHDISLDIQMPGARIEDMLALAVKTTPPLMRGDLMTRAKLHIPPGPERVPLKIELSGNLDIRQVSFSNPKFQDKVDSLSMRAQGKPQVANAAGSNPIAQVSSAMSADFQLAHGMVAVNNLHYQIPGALVLLNGVYSLDGQVFEFVGHVRTDAMASQMVTGWKSTLLKAVNPFLKKNGAGMELPIQISGTKSDPHIGLAMHGTDESTKDMAAGIKAKTATKH